MILPPVARKVALTGHVLSSVGLLGAVGGFLVLSIAGLRTQDPGLARSFYVAMDLVARSLILPLAFAALATGLVQSLGSRWGLFRHWWVLAKLLVTLFATAVLLTKMALIAEVARAAAATDVAASDLRQPRMELTIHAGAGLLVLLIPLALSVFKPRGWRLMAGTRPRDPLQSPATRSRVRGPLLMQAVVESRARAIGWNRWDERLHPRAHASWRHIPPPGLGGWPWLRRWPPLGRRAAPRRDGARSNESPVPCPPRLNRGCNRSNAHRH